MGGNVVLLVEIVVTAVLASAVGLALLVAMRPRRQATRPGLVDLGNEAAFLFDGETLVDATPAGRALLAHSPLASGGPWLRLVAWLDPRFPGVAAQFQSLPVTGQVVMPNAEGDGPPLLLTAELRGGLTRIALSGAGGGTRVATDPVSERATAEELALLRAVVTSVPMPVWQSDPDGAVVWANTAYLALVSARLDTGQDFVWPLPQLFDGLATRMGADRQRQRIELPSARVPLWFDLSTAPLALPGQAGTLHFALPADATVQAETALKGFMQTLARTFAHLSTGLAIFDQDRKLALYNPALVDLTGLPPDFLSARPRLVEVLDAMRERSMLPEPRDYRSWRRQIAELENAAAHGHFEETWSLPGGQTYRVTGRPHPNGALALMLDDISTEVGQTRRYRADLELGQAVIDAMDEAITVFSAAGTLVLSNAAYAALWDHDPGGTLDNDATISAVAAHWRDRTAPTIVWDRAEAFAVTPGPRQGWSDEVRLSDGRLLLVRFERLAGGATLAGFRVAGGVAAAPPQDAVFASVRRSA